MKAAYYETHGTAREVLRVGERPRPEPGPGQVRVRIRRSALNSLDVKLRSGYVPQSIDGYQIPHLDGSGEIDAVGYGVEPGRVGQQVWVWFGAVKLPWGTAAEWTVVDQRNAVPLPEGISHDFAACLGIPAITAHHCLFKDGPISGRTVLVAGGAGAVGHYAVEMAKWAGATVVSTVSDSDKAELARKAGADTVVNYRNSGAIQQIKAAVEHVDRIIEVDLAANLDLDLAVVGPSTTVITYAAANTNPLELHVRSCMTANVTLSFVQLLTVGAPTLDVAAKGVSDALCDGALSPLPTTNFALDEVVAAHEAVESGLLGRVVIEV
ncbi:Zinc-type alcohol dehydrogenase-like protein [Streptomyces sp. RB17]|uniref:NADPH:quinone reductase n=1 Tax=Streptomyces sp. RB17 TaxID=2585197 RepID=UPI001297A4DD|nr:NADPH:quinone reductase [Streptomyces sp. RB17]MQY40624.1 Zinc-type alcohol dehydrogenase-like protein [Streptomyces sp. RB17]